MTKIVSNSERPKLYAIAYNFGLSECNRVKIKLKDCLKPQEFVTQLCSGPFLSAIMCHIEHLDCKLFVSLMQIEKGIEIYKNKYI